MGGEALDVGPGVGQQGARLGLGHRPARPGRLDRLLCQGCLLCRVREGSQRSGPRFHSWHPPGESWETPFCSEGPSLSCFPPPPQLLRVQPCPAAPRVDCSPLRAHRHSCKAPSTPSAGHDL